MQKVILLLASSLMLSGCVTSRYEILYKNPCSSLIPEGNTKPVPGAKLPTVGDDENLFRFGGEQTGQLDKANKQGLDNLSIIKQCEERDRTAVIVPKQKVIGIAIKKK